VLLYNLYICFIPLNGNIIYVIVKLYVLSFSIVALTQYIFPFFFSSKVSIICIFPTFNIGYNYIRNLSKVATSWKLVLVARAPKF
jgi:hypothetical protein